MNVTSYPQPTAALAARCTILVDIIEGKQERFGYTRTWYSSTVHMRQMSASAWKRQRGREPGLGTRR